MASKAKVTSLEALEAFRSQLIVYLSEARPALEEVSSDVLRLRLWLENDQRLHWENQFRRRTKQLEEAQQALFTARVGTLQSETAALHFAVQRAKRSVEEAEIKLRTLKRWSREFEGQILPLAKQTDKLQTVFTNDMVKAVAYLTQAISTLAEYADLHPSYEASGSAPASVASSPGVGPGVAPIPGPPAKEGK